MKLNIEVDSESFEKTIKDGMENLSKEELGSIIKEVIYQAFTRCSIFSDMLVKTEKVGWGSTETTTLGPLAEAAIKSIDMETALAPFKTKMVNALIENHSKIIESMLFRCMIENITNDSYFRCAIEDSIRRVLTREANRE